MSQSTLKKHMKPQHKAALGDLPTYHQNCVERTGVARPGKTARDRAKKNRPEAA